MPELEAAPAGARVDVAIRRRAVASVPEQEGVFGLVATPEGAMIETKGVARFRITADSIDVDPEPDASERNVRLFLLGSAMGAVLHLRRLLPLHANAIVRGEQAIAFLGHSGAGKSTLAAAFHDRGCLILSDDVCAVRRADDGRFIVEPGIPRLRLWRDAAERSGRIVEDYERAFDSLDKYTVPITRAAPPEAVPLGAIYLLEKSDAVEPAIRRLTGMAGVDALVANTYRGAFLQRIGDKKRHLELCIELARSVPVFALWRAWDAARIGMIIDAVEAHLAGLASAEMEQSTRAGGAERRLLGKPIADAHYRELERIDDQRGLCEREMAR